MSESDYTTFGVNENNDLYTGPDGNFVILTGNDAIEQNCLQAMKGQFGEMVLSPSKGIPNLSDVWLSLNQIKWEAAARLTLLGIDGVISLQSFVVNIANGALNYTAKIQTVFSASLQINGVITRPT